MAKKTTNNEENKRPITVEDHREQSRRHAKTNKNAVTLALGFPGGDEFEKDLTEILDYFQMLDEIPGEDTLGFNPIIVEDAFREDEPKTEIDPEELLKDMKTYDDYIRGPRLS